MRRTAWANTQQMQVVIAIFVKVFMVIITANVCCHGHDFLAGHDLDYYQGEQSERDHLDGRVARMEESIER